MRVRIGVGMGLHGFALAKDFWRWVALCEDSAIDSIWCSDRLVSKEPTFEPVTLATAMMGVTRRLRFGMNVLVLPFRDPLLMAKQCALADWLGDGRLITAVGAGHSDDTLWENVGRRPDRRGRRCDEMLEIMTRLWREDHVTFQGEFYQYKDVSISPKPARQPARLWIGGDSPGALRRAGRFGDGWIGSFTAPAECRRVISDIRQEAAHCGRTVPDDGFGHIVQFRFGRRDDEQIRHNIARRGSAMGEDLFVVGDADDILSMIKAYVDAGIRTIVCVPLMGDDEDLIEQTVRLAREVLPRAEALTAN